MRILPVILVVLLIAAGVGLWQRHEQAVRAERARIEGAKASVQRLAGEIRFRAGSGATEVNGRGWPLTVDPGWFNGDVPRNPLVTGSRPWLEVAPAWQHELVNPPKLVALERETASFWYNPGNGAVRARVGPEVSDRRALEIYNRVNGTSLTSLLLRSVEPPAVADAPK